MNKKYNVDGCGCRTDCHFLVKTARQKYCSALVDFYKADDSNNLCGDCPFFKTDEEFAKGWKKKDDKAASKSLL